MRIDNRLQQGPEAVRVNDSSEASAVAQERGLTSSDVEGCHSDSVSLSSLASLAKLAMESSDAERAAEVERLKADYEAGRLEVDADELARVLVDRMLGLS